LAFVVMGLSFAALGQSGGTKGSRTTTVPAPTAPSNQPNQVIMLSGNVITADGAPLSETVSIERVCNGRVSREGRSDFQGYFTISLGQYPGLSDPESSAETSGRPGLSAMSTLNSPMSRNTSPAARLLGCELRASLAGFRSSSVLIPTEDLGSGVGVVKVGTIVLERMGEAPGATVSATSLNAPKDAKKAYDKGHHAIAGNKLPEAQQDLEKAVQLHPQYATAWLDLGWVYVQQNQLDKARNAFAQARAADATFVPAYVGLASVAVRESKWTDAADFSARATQLDGVDFPVAFYYNSLANYRLGNMEQAEKSARKAETLGAQRTFPQVSLLLGVMLANRHDYSGAADHFRSYLKATPTAPNADRVRQQLAEVEKLGAADSKAEAVLPVK
jgi:tetratricopeptide (TPR) repeat protein